MSDHIPDLNQVHEASSQPRISLILTRSPLSLVLIIATACFFSLGFLGGWFGLVQPEPGQGRKLLLIVTVVLWAAAVFEFFARRNQKLELDPIRVRVWDWRGQMVLDVPHADIKELRWERSGEGGCLWLITRRAKTKITGFSGIYDLATALRKLGTVKVDESL